MISPTQQLSIDDTDLSVVFDDRVWTVHLKWMSGELRLSNNCPECAVAEKHLD